MHFYLIIEDAYGSQEFISESERHLKSIEDVVDRLAGGDATPVSVLEISDDSLPQERLEDAALAYLDKLQADDYRHDEIVRFYPWLEPYLDEEDPEDFIDWRIEASADYRASVL